MLIYRIKISIQYKNIVIISIRLFVSICISNDKYKTKSLKNLLMMLIVFKKKKKKKKKGNYFFNNLSTLFSVSLPTSSHSRHSHMHM